MSTRLPRPACPRAVLALLAACLLVLTGCSSLRGTGNLEYVSGDGQVLEIPVADRGDPVELAGTTLEGEPLDLAEDRGTVVVVNVWWSGCGPCIKEMPMLTATSDELGGSVDFVGINIRDSSVEDALAFERGVGADYPSLYDEGGELLLAFDGRVSPKAMPSTAVLDRQGRVAAVISGAIPTQTTLRDVIDKVVSEDG